MLKVDTSDLVVNHDAIDRYLDSMVNEYDLSLVEGFQEAEFALVAFAFDDLRTDFFKGRVHISID